MTVIEVGRPLADEYAPFYAGYVTRVPEGSIVPILHTQLVATQELLQPLSEAQTLARPTPADWNIREVLGHITDAERVFAYRALRIGRGDTTPLPGFNQDDYVRAAAFAEHPLADLLEAYAAQRQATIVLFKSFSEDAWLRRGVVADHPCSVRAWAYILAGHERHHIADFHDRYAI